VIEPTVALVLTRDVPNQARRVHDGPEYNRPRNQTEERQHHQGNSLSQTLVLRLDASVIHQYIANFARAAKYIDDRGDNGEYDVRHETVVITGAGCDCIAEHLRWAKWLLVQSQRGALQISFPEDGAETRDTGTFAECRVVQDRSTASMAG